MVSLFNRNAGILLCLFLGYFSFTPVSAQYGDGSDGDLISIGPDTIALDSTRAEAFDQKSPNVLKLNAPAHYHKGNSGGFQANDHVIIVQMIDETDPSNRGRYMLTEVDQYDSTIKELTTTDTIPIDSFHFDTAAGDRVQVISLPLFKSVVIGDSTALTCHQWNGHTGGILSFKVENRLLINNGGSLYVEGKGFCNPNSGGKGGDGGDGGNGAQAPPLSDKGANGVDSRNGDGPKAKRPGGQILEGTDMVSGGCGGRGGVGYNGDKGMPGDSAKRYPVNNGNFLMLGQAGHGGKGGHGAQGGGGGGSGGNGYYQGGNGQDGKKGESGGKGGKGGCGAGAMYVMADTIMDYNTRNTSFWAKGGPGFKGDQGGQGGQGGKGGNGGDGACKNGKAYGAGGGGGYGKRGDGGDGGDAGMVGTGGSILYKTNKFLNIPNEIFDQSFGKPAGRSKAGGYVDTWPSKGKSPYFFSQNCFTAGPCANSNNQFGSSNQLFCNYRINNLCQCDSVFHKLKLTDSVIIEGNDRIIFVKNDPANNYRIDCKYCTHQEPSISCVEKFFDSQNDNNPRIKIHGCNVVPKINCDCLFKDIADYLFNSNCSSKPCFTYEGDTAINFQIANYYFDSQTLTDDTLFCSPDCRDPNYYASCDSLATDTCCTPPPEACYKTDTCLDSLDISCEQPILEPGCNNLLACCQCPIPSGSYYDCPIAGECGAPSDTPKIHPIPPPGTPPSGGDKPDTSDCKNILMDFFSAMHEKKENNQSGEVSINLPEDFTGVEDVPDVPENCWPCNGDVNKTITYNVDEAKPRYTGNNTVSIFDKDATIPGPGIVNLCGGDDGGDKGCHEQLEQFFADANKYYQDGQVLELPADFEDPKSDEMEPLPYDCWPCPLEEISHELEYADGNKYEITKDEKGTVYIQEKNADGEPVGEPFKLCNEGSSNDCLEQFFADANQYYEDGQVLELPADFENPKSDEMEPLPDDCLPCPLEEISHELEYVFGNKYEITKDEQEGTIYIQEKNAEGEPVNDPVKLCNLSG
jgi:hypothetical protein